MFSIKPFKVISFLKPSLISYPTFTFKSTLTAEPTTKETVLYIELVERNKGLISNSLVGAVHRVYRFFLAFAIICVGSRVYRTDCQCQVI